MTRSCVPHHRAPRAWLVAVLALSAAACTATVEVTAEVNPAVDLSRCRTYGWLRPPLDPSGRGADPDLQQLDWTVRRIVDTALTRKGFQRAAGERPDCGVDYEIAFKERTTDTVRDYAAYRSMGGLGGPQEAYVRGYEEGSLIVVLVDGATRALAWRGVARAITAKGEVDEVKRAQRIEEAVGRMFESVPSR